MNSIPSTPTISASSIKWLSDNKIIYSYTKDTDSTQDLAKKESFELKNSLKVYITDYQKKGRGRVQNRLWISENQNNFLSTWSFKLNKKKITPALSKNIGEQTVLACKKIWPILNWRLKLPNDIFLNDKKIAGLLIDILNQGDQSRLLIGIGFNIYSSPNNLEQASTHLSQETENFINWESFLDALLKNWTSLNL